MYTFLLFTFLIFQKCSGYYVPLIGEAGTSFREFSRNFVNEMNEITSSLFSCPAKKEMPVDKDYWTLLKEYIGWQEPKIEETCWQTVSFVNIYILLGVGIITCACIVLLSRYFLSDIKPKPTIIPFLDESSDENSSSSLRILERECESESVCHCSCQNCFTEHAHNK